MAVTVRQTGSASPNASPSPVTGITSGTIVVNDLLVMWLNTAQSGHISAISIQDDSVTSGTYATNSDWNVSASAQAAANFDFVMAWRLATSTDVAHLTKVQWVFTATSLTFSVAEFDDLGTGFSGTPTIDPAGIFASNDASATTQTIQALPSGTSKNASGELAVFGIGWSGNNGGFVSWSSPSNNPPFPTPTTTGGTPLASRMEASFCITNGSVTTSNTVTSTISTGKTAGVVGVLFYDPGSPATGNMLALF